MISPEFIGGPPFSGPARASAARLNTFHEYLIPRNDDMLTYAILALFILCLLNIAAHAGGPSRAPHAAAIVFRWLPAALATGTAAALTLGGAAFLLSLAAG